MAVSVTARDSSIKNATKRYAEEKGEKLFRFFDGITKVEMVLGNEGQLYRAEVVIFVRKGEPITAHVDQDDLKAAIDLVTDQAIRSLTKYKEKLKSHRAVRIDQVPQPAPEPLCHPTPRIGASQPSERTTGRCCTCTDVC